MVGIENVDVNISWIFTNSCFCGFLGFGRVFQEKSPYANKQKSWFEIIIAEKSRSQSISIIFNFYISSFEFPPFYSNFGMQKTKMENENTMKSVRVANWLKWAAFCLQKIYEKKTQNGR